MAKDFYEVLESRRSHRVINDDIQVSEERIQEILKLALKHTPSAFNSQTARFVLLTGEAHHKLWSITTEVLKGVMGDADFTATQAKMDAFDAGYGTVLFFEDQDIVKGLQEAFPLYADNFPIWSEQGSGMNQFAVWLAFESEGIGASLQHYNPLIDEKVAAEWNIPSSWKLTAQMPFGNPVADAGDKEFKPLEERIKFYK